MSKKFDAEDVAAMILGIMKGGPLNNQISAIETEKNAASQTLTPGLAQVDDTSYFFQTWNDKILNMSPAIFYGFEDMSAIDGGGVAAKKYKCFVEIVLVNNGLTDDFAHRLLRYSRALEELFVKAFDKAAEMGKVTIEQVRPISFKVEENTSDEVMVGGILIGLSLV